MFCHECDFALGDGQPYVWVFGNQLYCFECAFHMGLLVNGQSVFLYGSNGEYSKEPLRLLQPRIDAALALHWEESTVTGIPAGFCASCSKSWPCPTVRALKGGEE